MDIVLARVFALALVGFVAACGGDDSDEGSTSAGGGGSGGSSGGGSGATSGSGGTPEGGTSGVGAAGGTGGANCLGVDVLSTLDDHLQDVIASGSLLATHPSANEATSFFLAPGLPEPPGFVATFASLFMPCSDPTLFDPFCEEGHCTRIECTGEGAGWVNHAYLDATPFEAGGFSFSSATLDNAWADGADGSTFTIAAMATGPGGADWSMTGSGALDLGGVTLQESYPNLFSAGDAKLSYDSAASPKGGVEVAGVVIAEVGADGHLVATGNCPP